MRNSLISQMAVNCRRMTLPGLVGQAGIVLITVLMILVFLSIFAVAVVERQDPSVRRASNMLEAEQSFQIAIGAEQWAVKLLE